MSLNMLLESLHVVEFAFLYLLIVIALVVNRRFSKTTNLFAAIIAMVYGLVDEIHQLYVVDRSFTFIDLVKDWFGVSLTWFFVHYYHFKEKKESAPVDA
ncbi:VanZ family protein [Halobacillus mangrovi]|uniref:VanZ family protein n=1 Tax=Halobacillus mangrovi TaxID=402384 RepID=UPI003D9529B8